MALVADDGLIGVAMTQAVRHIIIMVWGTGLALCYFACIARALRVRAERVLLNRQRSHPQRLGCAWPRPSPEAARALVKRLRLPRQKANDGRVLACPSILSEITTNQCPRGHQPVTTSLNARNESPREPNWGGPPGYHLVSRASIFASPLILPPGIFQHGKFVASKSFVARLSIIPVARVCFARSTAGGSSSYIERSSFCDIDLRTRGRSTLACRVAGLAQGASAAWAMPRAS